MKKAESLNNIFRVTIGIAPLSNYDDSSVNGKSATAMNGKSFTIGSVGFTYRQGTSAYGAGVQNRTGDISFDDYAQVKSLTSMQFENAVADVDIYKANTRTEKINTALALYAQLSDYQRQYLPLQEHTACFKSTRASTTALLCSTRRKLRLPI